MLLLHSSKGDFGIGCLHGNYKDSACMISRHLNHAQCQCKAQKTILAVC